MKLRDWLVCTLALAGLMGAVGIAGAQTEENPINGLWVDGSGSGLRSQQSISDLVSIATLTGFNTIIADVRSEGDSHAVSSIEPRAENIAPGLMSPLSALNGVASTQDNPLQVWAAVNVLSVHRGATLPPQGHVMQQYPAWVMEDRIGGHDAREDGVIHHFLDPGITGAREYTVDVILDLVSNSSFDALVLNNLRYPEGGREWGYGALALREFQDDVGDVGVPSPDDPVWVRWRQDRVTTLLTEISTTVRAVRPDLPIYVCAETAGSSTDGFESSDTFNEFFQDWPRWIRAGLCDGVIVKLYRDGRREESSQDLGEWLHFTRDFSDDTVIICGFSGRMNYRNYLFRQMRMANSVGGNMVLFDYDHPSRDSDAGFWEDLRVAVIRNQRLLHGGTDEAEAQMPEFPSPPPESPDTPTETSVMLPETPVTLPETSGALDDSPSARPEEPAEEFTAPASTPDASSADTFYATTAPAPLSSEMTPPTISEGSSPSQPFGLDLSGTLPPPTDLSEIEETPTSGSGNAGQSGPGVFEDIPTAPAPRPYTSLIAPAGSDTITTTDGRVIVGEIVDESASLVMIQLESGNAVQIPRSRISMIERGQQ